LFQQRLMVSTASGNISWFIALREELASEAIHALALNTSTPS